jgi:hypothetical protein
MPAADEAGVAAAVGHAQLVALDAAGRTRWTVAVDELRDVAPALAPDVVVAATEDGVAAFDRTDGRVRWGAPSGGERPTAPVLVHTRARRVAAVATWEGHAMAVDVDTGVPLWRVALPQGAIAAPVASDDTLVVACEERGEATVVGLDANTGARRWERAVPADGVGGPAVVHAHRRAVVVLVAGDRRVHAFDPGTGAVVWRADTAGGAGSPEVAPAAIGGDVVVADRLTGMVRLRAADGARRWRTLGPGAAVRGGPAVVARGTAALPVDAGGFLLTRGGGVRLVATDGRVVGMTAVHGLVVAATREGDGNGLRAYAVG